MAKISLPTIKVNRAIVDDIFHYMVKIIFQSNIHYYIKLFTSLRNKQDTVPDKLIKKLFIFKKIILNIFKFFCPK